MATLITHFYIDDICWYNNVSSETEILIEKLFLPCGLFLTRNNNLINRREHTGTNRLPLLDILDAIFTRRSD